MPIVAALIGVGFGLTFAPSASWIASGLMLLVLVGLIERAVTTRRAALLGFMFGLGWFGAGIHWLYISLHDYGEMAPWLAIAAVAALSAYLSLFPALAAGLWFRLRGRLGSSLRALSFAALWTAAEWLRATLFTGFPWIATGYAQVDGPLRNWAPIGGIELVTFLTAYVASELAILAVPTPRVMPARVGQPVVMFSLPPFRVLPIGGAVVLLASSALLGAVDWTTPLGQPITVRLAQGNVAQDVKFDPAHLEEQFNIYDDLRRSGKADLIALPETAYPVPMQDWPSGHLERLAEQAKADSTVLITGVPIIDPDASKPLGGDWYNAAISIGSTPGASADAAPPRYAKHHLVPFGEFVPFGFRWFVDAMVMPLGDFTRGARVQAPFAVKDQRVGVNICYEDLFGDEIAATLRQDQPASILLNLSNIAWFGDTIALPQHLAASRMRAIETGRPMLRATNTGITASIDSRGRVRDALAPFTRGVLQGTVQGMQGSTPYVRFGDTVIAAVLALSALLIVGAVRRNR
ncbi:apolipoprotein N-acyltransferase [soil metagenome]